MKRLFLLALIICPSILFAQPKGLGKKAESILPKVIEWRRHLHQFPELSNREFKTAEYIAAHLKSLGYEVQTEVAKTGVIAILKGGKPGPTVALRADMDGLPVEERNDLAFKSVEKSDYLGNSVPVMHACGHDTHVAIMMGVAEVLMSVKKDVPGTVKFIFQPAEEGPPGDEDGGAALMVKEGVLQNPKVDAVFGLHINSGLETGFLGYKKGATMASSDWIDIEIQGKQAHGAYPWQSVDPIVIGAQIINSIQTVVSRMSELTVAPVVVTIGKINAGVRNNIIPEKLTMGGTIRTLDPAMHKEVHEKLRRIITKTAEASGATAKVTIRNMAPVTYNDPKLTEKILPALVKASGKNKLVETDWVTGAEDFSYFHQNIPGFYFNLGGRPSSVKPEDAPSHHTPNFFVDDSKLDVGVKAFVNIVFEYAKK
ncbi:MAG: amidohydrolase [Bacteroidetes bacterium]|nr:amidohydrolase [Bacteroidota bacterium]